MNHSRWIASSLLLVFMGFDRAGARPEQALPPPGSPTPYPGQPIPVPREDPPKPKESPFGHLVVGRDPSGIPYLFHAVTGPAPEGGVLVVVNPGDDGPVRPLTAENAGSYFERIDTPGKALELTQLLSWGTLVRSRQAFERILKALPGSVGDQPSLRLEDLRFEVLAQPRTDGSFDVAYTAFIMEHGPGAGSHVSRLVYRVGKDGGITAGEAVLYLKGPSLSSQPELPVNAAEREAQKEAARLREAFLDAAFADRRDWIPPGFNKGWRGER